MLINDLYEMETLNKDYVKTIKKKRSLEENMINKKIAKQLFIFDYDVIKTDENGFYNLNDMNTLKYILDKDYRKFIKETTDIKKLILNINRYNNLLNIDDKDIFNVYKLNISLCFNLRYIGNLDNLIELDIKSCDNLLYISKLKNLNKLNISNCHKLNNISSSLINLTDLNIEYCNNLLYISDLKSIKSLNIKNCNYIRYIYNLKKLIYLDLSNVPNIDDIYNLDNLQYLNIFIAHNVSYLSNLSNLTDIILRQCSHFNLNSPSKLKYVSLDNCSNYNIDFDTNSIDRFLIL